MTDTFNPSQKNVTILLGAPGSGKGTQAAKLSKELGIPHISTGDLFRDNIRNQTELGKTAQNYTNAGKLVPDEFVLDMLFQRVSNPDCVNGYLLDGFPRTIPQAEALQARLDEKNSVIAINISVDDAVVVKRISGRVSCKECGEIYNVYFSPPKQEGVCDACASPLFHRPDDTEAVVEERLNVYNKQTKPLIEFYSNLGVLTNVNGDQAPDQVYAEISSLVE